MKWNNQNIESFIKSCDLKIKAILIHSDNEGFVNQCEKDIAKSVIDINNAFLFDEFDGSKMEEAELFNALNTLSLTMERRIVRISSLGKKTAEIIKKVVKEYDGDTLILIKSSYLKKDSALRKLFIADKSLAEIVNYGDSERDIKSFILSISKSYNKTIDADALNFIAKNNGLDRLIVKSEMEKLITFTFDKDNITLDDALKVIDDNSSSSIDDVIYGVIDGNFKKFSQALNKMFLEENPSSVAIMVTRMMMSHFDKIRLFKDVLKDTNDMSLATRSIKPPLHFSIEESFKRQASSLSFDDINKAFKILFELEASLKGGKVETSIITEHYLSKIARIKTNS